MSDELVTEKPTREMADPRPELIIGLVGAVGLDLDFLTAALHEALREVKYETVPLRLSGLLSTLPKWRHLTAIEHEDDRISGYQQAGNTLRRQTVLKYAMALLGIGAIVALRKQRQPDGAPACDTAFILRSLKTPAEVQKLRQIYGGAFSLVAAYADHGQRVASLAQRIAESRHEPRAEDARWEAEKLVKTDLQERDDPYGQDVASTFPMADLFVDMTKPDEAHRALKRFVRLIFGHPFITPSADEYAMFLARAAALRSADLSRQVGALIASQQGDVIAVGVNEVPKFGGGQYWEGDDPDHRDWRLGNNRSAALRVDALNEILMMLKRERWLSPDHSARSQKQLLEDAQRMAKNTLLMESGEYGRMVHAEMAALLDAAKRGVSTEGQRLFTTTFPCHNCAKHIIAAGISEVVYIDPYPKSLAFRLHSDALSPRKERGHVVVRPFSGVAPRQYMQLFEMPNRRDASGDPRGWDPRLAAPRIADPERSDVVRGLEDNATKELETAMAAAGLDPE